MPKPISRKNKKNILSLSSAEFAQRVVMLMYLIIFGDNLQLLCKSLFMGKIRKKIHSLSSAEFVQRVVNVN